MSVFYGSVSQQGKPADQKLSHQNVHIYQGFLTCEFELIAVLCVDFGFSQLHHLHRLAEEDFSCFLCFVEFTCRMLPA